MHATGARFPLLPLAVLLFVAGCRPGGPTGAGDPGRVAVSAPAPLTPAGSLTGRLAPGQQYLARLPLEPREALRLHIDQSELDLEVVLRSPAGNLVHHFDSPFGRTGPEEICFVPEKGGEYELVLAPFGRAGGGFRVQREERRPARESDLLCERGARLFMEAEALRLGAAPLPELLAAYGEARKTWREAGETFLEGLALREMGLSASRLGHREEATQAYEEALQRFRSRGAAGPEIEILNMAGQVALHYGDLTAAEQSFQAALESARRAGETAGEAMSLNNLALVHEERGSTFEALDLYRRSLERWKAVDRGFHESQTQVNLGRALLLLGYSRAAGESLTAGLEMAVAHGNEEARAGALVSLGWGALADDDAPRARELLGQALQLHRAAGRRAQEAGVLDRLGTAAFRAGDLVRAREAYEASLSLTTAQENDRSRAHTLTNLAAVHLQSGERLAARNRLELALALFESLDSPDGHAHALSLLARLEREEGNGTAAQAALEDALAVFERLRDNAREQGGRFQPFEPWVDVEETYVDLLVELGSLRGDLALLESAYVVSDEARARNFSDELREAELDPQRGSPRELVEQEKALRQAVLRAARQQDEAARERAELQLQLVRLEGRSYAREERRRLEALRLPLPELQSLLGDDSVLLSFELADPRSFVFRVGRSSLQVFELPARSRLEAQARLTYEALERSHLQGSSGQARLLATALSEVLLSQALAGPEADRLILVGDGWLYSLPWAALPRPGSDRLLVDDFEIVTLPSAGMLRPLRDRVDRRSLAPRTLAAVADPVFTAQDPRVTGTVPGGGQAHCPPSPEPPDLDRLDHSLQEAEAAVSFADAEGSLLLSGFEARRDVLVDGTLDEFQIVHLATHALVDEVSPELSSLRFSAVDARGCAQAGGLGLLDLYDLRLRADLVVLSACSSAQGERVRGDGVTGFARSFFYAGAARLILSLWPVDDEATAFLMERFYRAYLGEGLPAAAALRRAQQETRRQERWSAPYYWAGFILQGDWKPSRRPAS